jgi:hypothetical protein
MIADSGRQLLALVDDVLDLSKIEAGKVTVVVRDFDAAALVRQVVESSRPLAAEKGLDLVAVAPDGPFMMRSDSGRVRQILLNLVGNAIKFTERGRIEVGLAHNGDDAVFSVTDTGRGISPRDVRRIFDAFVQVGDDAEPKAEGTGLGLALAREYAVLLGGSIEVESEPGVGSTFTVRLPRRAAEPAER